MARLDPYLGQSLKKIVPNAYVVMIFMSVSVSHGILQYEAKSTAYLYRGAMSG